MALHSGRFQFTIARLIGATMLVALAAWFVTSGSTLTVKETGTGLERLNLFPIVVWIVVLAAALGLLFGGKQGAQEGAKLGCAVLFFAWWITLAVVAIIQLYSLLVHVVRMAL